MKMREAASVFIVCFILFALLGIDLERNDKEIKECKEKSQLEETLKYLP